MVAVVVAVIVAVVAVVVVIKQDKTHHFYHTVSSGTISKILSEDELTFQILIHLQTHFI